MTTEAAVHQPAAESSRPRTAAEVAVETLASAGYQVIDHLGQGTAGTVYRARHPNGELVAVKVLHQRLVADRVAVQRFQREARVAMRLNHPNLVRAIEVGQQDGVYFLVMEYVAGESLAARLKREPKLPEAEAIRITLAVADALSAAHTAKLIHRDIKPANIMITERGVPKLTDMGLVKDSNETDLTRPNQGLGTPIFMAPEQFLDAKRVDARSDVYGLGIVLYNMLSGETPFPGPRLGQILDAKLRGDYKAIEQLRPDVSLATTDAIRRALQTRPELRPNSMAEFASLLRRAFEVLPGAKDIRPESTAPADPVWYLLWSRKGRLEILEAKASAVRKGLHERTLALHVCASRNKTGPFLPIGLITELCHEPTSV